MKSGFIRSKRPRGGLVPFASREETMKNIVIAIALLAFTLAIIGCMDHTGPPIAPGAKQTDPEPSALESESPPSSEDVTNAPADIIEIIGTVRYKEIEGGFHAIDANDGKKYDPINLPESYRKDGLMVRVTARIKTDMMNLRMYGQIIEIIDIAAQ